MTLEPQTTKGPFDTMGAHGSKFHFDRVGPHGTCVPLWHCRSKETIVTLRNLMEPKVHCDREGPHETKEAIVTLWAHMEPRVHCYTENPRRPR